MDFTMFKRQLDPKPAPRSVASNASSAYDFNEDDVSTYRKLKAARLLVGGAAGAAKGAAANDWDEPDESGDLLMPLLPKVPTSILHPGPGPSLKTPATTSAKPQPKKVSVVKPARVVVPPPVDVFVPFRPIGAAPPTKVYSRPVRRISDSEQPVTIRPARASVEPIAQAVAVNRVELDSSDSSKVSGRKNAHPAPRVSPEFLPPLRIPPKRRVNQKKAPVEVSVIRTVAVSPEDRSKKSLEKPGKGTSAKTDDMESPRATRKLIEAALNDEALNKTDALREFLSKRTSTQSQMEELDKRKQALDEEEKRYKSAKAALFSTAKELTAQRVRLETMKLGSGWNKLTRTKRNKAIADEMKVAQACAQIVELGKSLRADRLKMKKRRVMLECERKLYADIV